MANASIKRGFQALKQSIEHTTREKRAFYIERLAHFWERCFCMNPERYAIPFREPQRPDYGTRDCTIRPANRPEDEEHRTYKLVDGKIEEYTRIKPGWTPHDQVLAVDKEDLYPAVVGVCGHLCFIGFLAFGWFVREPLKKFYYRLDRRRIELERASEMEEIMEMEEEVKQLANPDSAGSSSQGTAVQKQQMKVITAPLQSDVSATPREKANLPREWRLQAAEAPSKRELHKRQQPTSSPTTISPP